MIVLIMRISIVFALSNFESILSAQDFTENITVHLTKDSFAAELEKMPHFVMFSHPPSSS